jgi:D-beta-D-heptose 7-phosphate kinase / D-beta-D-heptose 1-phosphate adenosyltransferase
MDRKMVESLFQRAAGLKCLVVGDLMLDEYLWGKTDRISPEAPVQVVDVLREDLRLGGAGNVANNLLALGCQVTVASVIGEDENGWALLKAFSRQGIDTTPVYQEPGRRTSRKTRVIASNQQIVRIDRETREPLSEQYAQQLTDWLQQNVSGFDVVLVSDYLKGVLTSAVLSAITTTAAIRKIPVLVDPKGTDYRKYRGATCLTPNRKEAEAASGVPIRDQESLRQAADTLMTLVELDNLLITRSEEGMSLFCGNGETVHIPTVAREVFDVTGAGDTVLALLACGLAGGLPLAEAARLANIAAGIAVAKLGTSTVTPAEIIDAVAAVHRDSDSKIKNRDVLATIMESERIKGRQIVFTNGCFDLLHAGHVKYLQAARRLGDLLIMGLNSDASVRRLKGPKRPLIGEEERGHILAALDCIDYVCLFDEDTPLELITALKPHILVKGGDYTADGVVGKEIVEANGGRVELIPFVDGKSTTNIIEKILERYETD